MIGIPICVSCKHYTFKSWTCAAYPFGIPDEIITGEVDHNKPYQDDHGIQFEAKPKKSWKGFY